MNRNARKDFLKKIAVTSISDRPTVPLPSLSETPTRVMPNRALSVRNTLPGMGPGAGLRATPVSMDPITPTLPGGFGLPSARPSASQVARSLSQPAASAAEGVVGGAAAAEGAAAGAAGAAESAVAVEGAAGAAAAVGGSTLATALAVIASGIASFAAYSHILAMTVEYFGTITQNNHDAGASLKIALEGSNNLTEDEKRRMGPLGFLGDQEGAYQAVRLMQKNFEMLPSLKQAVEEVKLNPSNLSDLSVQIENLRRNLEGYEMRIARRYSSMSFEEFYRLCQRESNFFASGLGVSRFADAGNLAKAAEEKINPLVDAINKNVIPAIKQIIGAYDSLASAPQPSAIVGGYNPIKPKLVMPARPAGNPKLKKFQEAFNKVNPNVFANLTTFTSANEMVEGEEAARLKHTPDGVLGKRTRKELALVAKLRENPAASLADDPNVLEMIEAYKEYIGETSGTLKMPEMPKFERLEMPSSKLDFNSVPQEKLAPTVAPSAVRPGSTEQSGIGYSGMGGTDVAGADDGLASKAFSNTYTGDMIRIASKIEKKYT